MLLRHNLLIIVIFLLSLTAFSQEFTHLNQVRVKTGVVKSKCVVFYGGLPEIPPHMTLTVDSIDLFFSQCLYNDKKVRFLVKSLHAGDTIEYRCIHGFDGNNDVTFLSKKTKIIIDKDVLKRCDERANRKLYLAFLLLVVVYGASYVFKLIRKRKSSK